MILTVPVVEEPIAVPIVVEEPVEEPTIIIDPVEEPTVVVDPVVEEPEVEVPEEPGILYCLDIIAPNN